MRPKVHKDDDYVPLLSCLTTPFTFSRGRCTAAQGGGGAKKFAVSPFFRTPPPLGGVRPEKKYPTPMCKNVSQPQFFSKEHH